MYSRLTNYRVLAKVVLLFCLTPILAYFFFTDRALILLTGIIAFGSAVGSVVWHRSIVHHSFDLNPWLERIGATFFSSTNPLRSFYWTIALHQLHHAFPDTARDPHAPRFASFPAGVSWWYRPTPELEIREQWLRYVPKRIRANSYFEWLDGHAPQLQVAYMATMFSVGFFVESLFQTGTNVFFSGASFVVYGYFVFVAYKLFIVDILFSQAVHVLGTRFENQSHNAGNVPFLWPILFAESFHADHHASPRSRVLGRHAWADPGFWLISLLVAGGLAEWTGSDAAKKQALIPAVE